MFSSTPAQLMHSRPRFTYGQQQPIPCSMDAVEIKVFQWPKKQFQVDCRDEFPIVFVRYKIYLRGAGRSLEARMKLQYSKRRVHLGLM